MRHTVTVLDVLKLFPHRKKSYAYKQLQSIRDCTGKMLVTVADLSEYTGLPEAEIRQVLATPGAN